MWIDLSRVLLIYGVNIDVWYVQNTQSKSSNGKYIKVTSPENFLIYYKYLYLHLTIVNIFTSCFSRLDYIKLGKQLTLLRGNLKII